MKAFKLIFFICFFSNLMARQYKIELGKQAPDFSSNSLSGDEISLKDILPKYKLVLIDFWASWCVPCLAEIPNLKKVYNDFAGKGFTILSVSLDNNVQSWENAIKKDSMTWIHVSELSGREETVAKLFKVNALPASVLIDTKGKIIALDLPGSTIKSAGGSLRGMELYEKIKNLLN